MTQRSFHTFRADLLRCSMAIVGPQLVDTGAPYLETWIRLLTAHRGAAAGVAQQLLLQTLSHGLAPAYPLTQLP